MNINLPLMGSYKGSSGIYSFNPNLSGINVSTKGFTGMGNSCCGFCGRPMIHDRPIFFNIDFEQQKDGEGIGLCYPCINETELRLKKFKKMSFDKLPLHLDEPNRFVLHLIKKRLNEGK